MASRYSAVIPYSGKPFIDVTLSGEQKMSVNYFREKKKYGFCAEVLAYEYMTRRKATVYWITADEETRLTKWVWSRWAVAPDRRQIHTCTVKFLKSVYNAGIAIRSVGRGWYVTTRCEQEQGVQARYFAIINGLSGRIEQSRNLQQTTLKPKSVVSKHVQADLDESVLLLVDALADFRNGQKERKALLDAAQLVQDFKKGLVSFPNMSEQETAAYVQERFREAVNAYQQVSNVTP